MATALTDTSVSQIERALADLRDPETPRTSVATHIVWAPKEWLQAAERTLQGMGEQHPSRTLVLTPEPRRKDGLDATVEVRTFEPDGERSISTEVVELRLKGSAAASPASVVLPLLISDLPVFVRWRGEPTWGRDDLAQLVRVADRLVVDSSEWRSLPAAFERLAELFDRIAVSDIAWTRTRRWRIRLAGLWPEIRLVSQVEVTGPQGDALLLAGWLRSRLRKHVDLAHRPGKTIRRVALDGTRVDEPLGEVETPSELLSEQLDVFGRDPVYEAAVARTAE